MTKTITFQKAFPVPLLNCPFPDLLQQTNLEILIGTTSGHRHWGKTGNNRQSESTGEGASQHEITKKKKEKKERKKEKKFLAIVDVANKIMPHQHQRCLYPNAQRYEYDSLHSKRVIKVADKIKVANNLTLRLEDYSELSRWAQCNHKGI